MKATFPTEELYPSLKPLDDRLKERFGENTDPDYRTKEFAKCFLGRNKLERFVRRILSFPIAVRGAKMKEDEIKQKLIEIGIAESIEDAQTIFPEVLKRAYTNTDGFFSGILRPAEYTFSKASPTKKGEIRYQMWAMSSDY